MSLKLKALGLSLIAALAVSAVAVMNASATAGGHFVSAAEHTEVKGFVSPAPANHTLHLVNHGLSGEVGCETQSYTATTTTNTVESLTVTPTFAGCTTTSNGQSVPVDVGTCQYTFTVAINTGSSTEQTAHLVCPGGGSIKVTHPNCTVTIHPQTVNGGITYTNTGTPHEVTLDSNVQFNTTRHGLCQFIAPTNGTGTLIGSATVKGFDTEKEQVAITAT